MTHSKGVTNLIMSHLEGLVVTWTEVRELGLEVYGVLLKALGGEVQNLAAGILVCAAVTWEAYTMVTQ